MCSSSAHPLCTPVCPVHFPMLPQVSISVFAVRLFDLKCIPLSFILGFLFLQCFPALLHCLPINLKLLLGEWSQPCVHLLLFFLVCMYNALLLGPHKILVLPFCVFACFHIACVEKDSTIPSSQCCVDKRSCLSLVLRCSVAYHSILSFIMGTTHSFFCRHYVLLFLTLIFFSPKYKHKLTQTVNELYPVLLLLEAGRKTHLMGGQPF